MTLKLNGTNSVAAPAYAGDDADTGLQCGTNELKLVTGGSARATVDSSGNLGIGTTSPSTDFEISRATDTEIRVTESSSGHYVNLYQQAVNSYIIAGKASGTPTQDLLFYAGGGEKARIRSGGGITFNGDTAAANALEDYEEGTWTADLVCATANNGSVTFSSNTGLYIKVGKLCFISIFLGWTASTRTGSNLELTGLPFTQQTQSFGRGGFLITYRANALTGLSNIYDLSLRNEANSTVARFQYGNGDGNTGTELSGSAIKNASAGMMISGCYITT